jgi:integrase
MRGHIRKRGSTYAIVINISPDPETGKRRQKWYSGYKNKKAAEAELTRLLGEVDQGTYVEPKKLTLAKYLRDEWLPAKQVSKMKPTTYEGYRMNCESHIIPALGGYKLQTLQPDMLSSFYRMLITNGRSDGKGGLSPKTVRHIHGIIHKALKDTAKRGYVPRNGADLADLPERAAGAEAQAPTEPQVWSPEQISAFLAGVAGDRMFAAWRLIATTGMRRGELLGLRWSDLDLETGRLAVQVARVRVGKVVVSSTPKTRAGKRVLQLDPATVAALKTWHARQAAERLAVGERYQDEGYVFTMPDGSPIIPNRFSIWFRKHVKRLGLPKIRLHDTRHSYATAGLARGVPVKVMSVRLGHASTAITENLYQHVLPAMDREAADKIAAVIDG